MPKSPTLDTTTKRELQALYREVMWLARRRNVTPSMARAWYTHVVAGRLCRRIRQFTGKVSRTAIASRNAQLRLEHHARIQTKLTELVARHLKRKRPDPREFIRVLTQCESVHIVTFRENYEAMKHDGDYRAANIHLVAWRNISRPRREELWRHVLRGRVANAADYAPT